MVEFEPKIVGFLCHHCAYAGADAAGRARKQYSANMSIIRLACSGRIDPYVVFKALSSGADGVLILGCHPGECHHRDGNHYAYKRTALVKKLLSQFGIPLERVRLDWVSANEGERFIDIVNDMVTELRQLGPCRLNA